MNKIIKTVESDIGQTIVLGLILLSLFFSVWMSQFSAWSIKVVVVLGSLLYTIWGIWHHSTKKDLTVPIIAEYLLVSGFFVTILFVLLSAR